MDCRGVGYLVIETAVPKEWSEFLEGVIGFMPESMPSGTDGGGAFFRMDDRTCRVSVEPATEEGYVVGWDFPSEDAWSSAIDELKAAGVAVAPCGMSEAAARAVSGVARLEDPFGNRLELAWGQVTSETPFDSPRGMSGFRAGELGVGHVLYNVPSCAQALEFYRDLLGLKVTDYFVWGENSAWFLRANERHHTVAFVDLPLPAGLGLNHFMVEADSLADVGRALDRAVDAGVEIVNSLGQHSNDKCVSFYMRTPGGTNVEVGVDQLRIDDANWQVIAWNGRGDYWGHRGPFMDEIADAKQ